MDYVRVSKNWIEVLRRFVSVLRRYACIDWQFEALALIIVLVICRDGLEGIGNEEFRYCSGEQEVVCLVSFWTVSSTNWPSVWRLTDSESKLTVVLANNKGSGLCSLGRCGHFVCNWGQLKRWSGKVEFLPLGQGSGLAEKESLTGVRPGELLLATVLKLIWLFSEYFILSHT